MQNSTITLNNVTISENASEAADSIFHHSFAIYRVDDDTAKLIETAWNEERAFFSQVQTPGQTGRACCGDNSNVMMTATEAIKLYRSVINGHLQGFNAPSDAKFLFRAFPCVSTQLWPNNEFRNASIRLSTKLHCLLLDCCDKIEQKMTNIQKAGVVVKCPEEPTMVGTTTAFTPEIQEEQHKTKRRKLSHKMTHQSAKPSSCPLDYFLYHQNKQKYVVNCSEHVDRGALICVCLTTVPGLEIRPRSEPHFICPESIAYNENLYQDRKACSNLVCIMAGGQLQKMFQNDATVYSNHLEPCVHRVSNDLRCSRLSISYELRCS